MSWYLRRCVFTFLLIALAIISTVTYGSISEVSSSNNDLRYSSIWSLDVPSIEIVTSIIDYNSDGVNDIVGVGNYTVVFINGLNGSIIYNYTVGNGYRIYTLVPINDINSNGYNEMAIVLINLGNRSIEMDLVEPGTSNIIVSQNYTIPDPNEYSLVLAIQNGILEDNILSVIVSGVKVVEGLPPQIIVKTWIYRFDLINGEEQPVEIIDDKAYTLWTNQIPSDNDGDGLLEIASSIKVKGYMRFEITITGIKIYGGVSVKEPIYEWEHEYPNLVPGSVFKPYSLLGRLVIGYAKLSISGYSVTMEGLKFIGYQLGSGAQKYDIFIDFDEYSLEGLSIVGNTIVMDLIDKDSSHGICRFYNGNSGFQMREIDLGALDDGSITSMSIGDIDEDSELDIMIGFSNKLYLTSLSNELDYLGSFSYPVYVNDGSVIGWGNESYYALIMKSDDLTRIYVVELIINDTTPPTVEIIYPRNNTILSTPFNVTAYVEEDYSEIVNITLRIICNDTVVAEIPMVYNESTSTATVVIENISDGDYLLVVEALNSNGIIGSNTTAVVVDNTEPIIIVNSIPVNGSRVLDKVVLRVEVYDRSFNKTIVYVNNSSYVELNESAFNITIDLGLFSDGMICIRIVSSDVLGHTSYAELVFWKDTMPPAISVSGIVNNSIVSSLLEIAINVSDITSANTSVYLGETLIASYSSPGTYIVVINTTEYPDGNYSIRIVSIDYIGLEDPLESMLELAIVFDNNPPLLTISGLREYGYLMNYSIYIVRYEENLTTISILVEATDVSLKELVVNITYIDGSKESIYLTGDKQITYYLNISLSSENNVAIVCIEVCDKLNRTTTRQFIVLYHNIVPTTSISWPKELNVTEIMYRGSRFTLFNNMSIVLTINITVHTYNVFGLGAINIPIEEANITVFKIDPSGRNIVCRIYVSTDNWTEPIEVDLGPGIYVIEVSMSDIIGLAGTSSYNVIIDAGPPVIEEFYIDVYEQQVNISWTIHDDLWVEKTILSINGVGYNVSRKGYLELELEPGTYTVSITAYDPLNRSSTISREIEIMASIETPTTTTPIESYTPTQTPSPSPSPTPTTTTTHETSPIQPTEEIENYKNILIILLIVLTIIIFIYWWFSRKRGS